MTVTDDDLRALVDKYRALVALRQRRDGGGDPGRVKAELRALSRRHPGCLRELDRLTAAALQDRLFAAERALTGAPVPPWLPRMLAYHGTLARLLEARRAGTQALPGTRLSRQALAAVAHTFSDDPTWLDALLFPPRD